MCRSPASPAPAACAQAVGRFAAEHPELPVIRGYGWAEPTMPPQGPPRRRPRRGRPRPARDPLRRQLPRLVAEQRGPAPGRHRRRHTPDPDNGVIERLADGTPSGTLREGPSAVAERAFPTYTVEQSREGILHFQRDVAGPLGLTTAHDANLRPGRDAALEAFEQLQDEGLLTARYCVSLWIMEDAPLAGADRGRRGGAGPSDGPARDGGLGQALRRRRDRGPHRRAQGAVRRQARLLRRAGLAAGGASTRRRSPPPGPASACTTTRSATAPSLGASTRSRPRRPPSPGRTSGP